MLRRALIALGLLTLAASAQAQNVSNPSPPNSINGAYNSSPPTCTAGNGCWIQTDVNGNLKVVSSGTPSGTQDVNITQVLGAAPSATNPIWVAPATANVPWAVSIASGAQASGSQPIGITPTDRTVTSATGASQTVASALATRKSILIVNTGNANCGINPTGGTAAIGGAGTITLTPTGSYSPRVPSLAAITAICTAGQPLYAEES